MPRDFSYSSDADLATAARPFAQLIDSDPQAFGVSREQADRLVAANELYQEKYRLGVNTQTRTRGAVIAKDESRAALRDQIRLIARIARSTESVSDEALASLGLPIRTSSEKSTAPSQPPILRVVSVTNHTVRLQLMEKDRPSRGKPASIIGATVFTHTGKEPAKSLDDWRFDRNVSRATFDITFKNEYPPGTKVWICAFWFNSKMESSRLSDPVSTYLAGYELSIARRALAA